MLSPVKRYGTPLSVSAAPDRRTKPLASVLVVVVVVVVDGLVAVRSSLGFLPTAPPAARARARVVATSVRSGRFGVMRTCRTSGHACGERGTRPGVGPR